MNAMLSYTPNLPIWQKSIGILLILAGLYQLMLFNIFGIISIILAYMVLKSEGAEINLESKTYRKIIAVLGLKFGKWQPLNNPKYISVFNTTENVTLRIVTAETTNSQPIIHLNLFLEHNSKITIYKTADAKEAFDIASHIADALNIDFLDATKKGNFRWVDKDNYRTHGQILHID